MDIKEYAKMSPYLVVPQPQASKYYKYEPPKMFTDLIEYSDSDDLCDELNAFSSIAFSSAPSAQCCVCM